MRSSALLLAFILLAVSFCFVPSNGEKNVPPQALQEKIKQSLASLNAKQGGGNKAKWSGAFPNGQKKGIPGASIQNPKLNDRQRFENLMKLKNEHGDKRPNFKAASHEMKFQSFRDKMKNLFNGANKQEWAGKLKQKKDL